VAVVMAEAKMTRAGNVVIVMEPKRILLVGKVVLLVMQLKRVLDLTSEVSIYATSMMRGNRELSICE
jgi:hypothetical protein